MNAKSNNQVFSMLIVIIIASVVLVGGAATAYFVTDGFGTKSNDDTKTAQKPNADDKSNADNKDNKPSSDTDEMPSWMKANYPLYPGSRVYMVKSHSIGANTTYTAGVTTKPDTDRGVVEKWYADQYAKDGWNLESHDSGIVNSTKGDYTAMIVISETSSYSGEVVVTISASKKG